MRHSPLAYSLPTFVQLFRSLRPDSIETWRRRHSAWPWLPIVPVSKTGLLCDSCSPSGLSLRCSYCSVFQRGVCIAAGLLGRLGGEISLGDHASGFLCGYRFLVGSGRGCGALYSLRRHSNPSLGLAGLSPAHARDAALPLHGRCRHGFLRHTVVTIRGASAMPAHRVQTPNSSPPSRPAGAALRGGAVSREPRTHPY